MVDEAEFYERELWLPEKISLSTQDRAMLMQHGCLATDLLGVCRWFHWGYVREIEADKLDRESVLYELNEWLDEYDLRASDIRISNDGETRTAQIFLKPKKKKV